MVDLRSDTVTHPTDAMRRAMLEAPLGDDVFGDDPTVLDLESKAANLLGKEAALFTPSGTMANTIAIALSTRPGDEMILMEDSHIFLYEGGGSARLWGVHSRPLPATKGCLTPQQVKSAIRADDPHHPRTTLVCLENTHNMQGGRVVPPELIDAVSKVCREQGLRLHLDGARLFHAAVALGKPLADLTRSVDTVSCCFSKGLSCPVGSVIAGSAEEMIEARRIRKVLGGGMRQVGILAAAASVALDEGIDRLADDHRRLATIVDGIRDLPELSFDPDPPESNIVFLRFADLDVAGHAALAATLEERGIRTIAAGERGIRLVVHRQISDDQIETAIAEIRRARG